mgnify:CR=1 FL=1
MEDVSTLLADLAVDSDSHNLNLLVVCITVFKSSEDLRTKGNKIVHFEIIHNISKSLL